MSYQKHRKYGGLVRYDHNHKVIHIQRLLNPPTHHARFVKKLKADYPDYQVVSPK